MKNRRLARIELYDGWDFKHIKLLFNALPDNCIFRGISRDIMRRNFIIYLEHENFLITPEGNILPKLEITVNLEGEVKILLDDEEFKFGI